MGGWKSDVAVLAEACGLEILAGLYCAGIVCSSCRKLSYFTGEEHRRAQGIFMLSFAGILYVHIFT